MSFGFAHASGRGGNATVHFISEFYSSLHLQYFHTYCSKKINSKMRLGHQSCGSVKRYFNFHVLSHPKNKNCEVCLAQAPLRLCTRCLARRKKLEIYSDLCNDLQYFKCTDWTFGARITAKYDHCIKKIMLYISTWLVSSIVSIANYFECTEMRVISELLSFFWWWSAP